MYRVNHDVLVPVFGGVDRMNCANRAVLVPVWGGGRLQMQCENFAGNPANAGDATAPGAVSEFAISEFAGVCLCPALLGPTRLCPV